MKENERNPVLEMAEQTVRNCEQAFRTGLKFQEEAGQRWGSLFNPVAPAPVFKKGVANLTGLVVDVIPMLEKRAEDVMDLVGKNAQRSAELMRKVVEVAETPVMAERENKCADFWKLWIQASRSNTEALLNINSRAVDAWFDFLQKSVDLAQSGVETVAKEAANLGKGAKA